MFNTKFIQHNNYTGLSSRVYDISTTVFEEIIAPGMDLMFWNGKSNQKFVTYSYVSDANIALVGTSCLDSLYCIRLRSWVQLMITSSLQQHPRIFQYYEGQPLGMKLPNQYQQGFSMVYDSSMLCLNDRLLFSSYGRESTSLITSCNGLQSMGPYRATFQRW